MNCRTGCPTPGRHLTWGECARAARLQLGDLGHGVKKETDTRLGAYAYARSIGLQPPTTQLRDSQGMIEAVGA